MTFKTRNMTNFELKTNISTLETPSKTNFDFETKILTLKKTKLRQILTLTAQYMTNFVLKTKSLS